MSIPFVKMQGIGNDYVYVDATAQSWANEEALARLISDRHFGVGGDGLIWIKNATSTAAKYRMQMHNADGSVSEMCGNGLRCVAKFLFDRGMETSREFPIETGAGNLLVEITQVQGGKATAVRINMGQPRLERGVIPMTGPAGERAVDQPIEVGGNHFRFTGVSMGNPHCVIFPDGPVTDAMVLGCGPLLEHHEAFPRRVNVEFVEIVSPSRLKQRTWERGAGETLACGTGASAVCVAGVLSGRSQRKVTIDLLGGALELEWRESDDCVYKTGPAVEVFCGEWPEGQA